MAEFRFNCPQCGQALEADESLRGQMVECPCCGKNIGLPKKCLRKVIVKHASTGSSSSPVTERIILTTQPSVMNFLALYIFLLLGAVLSLIIASCDSKGLSGGVLPMIGIAGFLGCLIMMFYLIAYCKTTKYTITNMRVIMETGILSRSTTTVRITDIRAMNLQRNLLQKMCNLASIAIATAATAGAEIIIFGIPEWERVMEMLKRRQC